MRWVVNMYEQAGSIITPVPLAEAGAGTEYDSGIDSTVMS